MTRPPFIETPETKAAAASRRWDEQYRGRNGRAGWDEIGRRLAALSEPTSADVDRITGNDSWTRTECGQCGAERVPVVVVGEPEDYESATAALCRDCVVKALALFEEVTP